MQISTDMVKGMLEEAQGKVLAEIRDDDNIVTKYMEKSFNSGVNILFNEIFFRIAEYELDQLGVSRT